jgi:hypothetical protein
MQPKITYTSSISDLSSFHKEFDAAIEGIKKNLGKKYSLYINDEPFDAFDGGGFQSD